MTIPQKPLQAPPVQELDPSMMQPLVRTHIRLAQVCGHAGDAIQGSFLALVSDG